jgi:hypothetical protein
MLQKLLHRWRALAGFDKVGVTLAGWEFLSLTAGLAVLPYLRAGALSSRALVWLGANGIGLGTALVAWILTHLLLSGRGARKPGETVREFVERELERKPHS